VRADSSTGPQPQSDYFVPGTPEEAAEFRRRLTDKKRIEREAAWQSVPSPIRIILLAFVTLTLVAFLAIMVAIVVQIPT